MDKITLLTDIALGEGMGQIQDGLGFSTYAQIMAKSVLGTQGPFTIGIFGEWGTGKTSLMRMIREELSSEDDVVTIWFNAWQYEKEEHPIVPLVATIIRELEQKRGKLMKLQDGGKSIINTLRAVAYGFSTKSTIKMPGLAEIEASFVAKDMIDRSEKITLDPLLDRSLYYNAFERISKLELSKKIKLIIIVDDLDRCFPDLAIKLLESIKLILAQPGFIFILGVARSVIEGYLEHRYKKDYGLADFQGRYYLDKIIQLPFYIPSHQARMESFMRSLLLRIDNNYRENFQSLLPIIGAASGGNPRASIRFVNNLIIDRAINEVLANTESMDLIPMEFFAVSRSLQQRWPDLYVLLVGDDEICSRIEGFDRGELIGNLSNDYGDERIINVIQQLITDNDLQNLLLSEIGKLWLGDSTLRGASVQFLSTQRVEAELSIRGKAYDLVFWYSLEDREIVSRIAEVLTRNDFRVLLTAEVFAGENVIEKMRLLFGNSQSTAYCISPNSSELSESEVDILQSTLQDKSAREPKHIIPILLPGSHEEDIPSFIRSNKYVDLRDVEIFDEKTLSFLINSLSRYKLSFLGEGRKIRIIDEGGEAVEL